MGLLPDKAVLPPQKKRSYQDALKAVRKREKRNPDKYDVSLLHAKVDNIRTLASWLIFQIDALKMELQEQKEILQQILVIISRTKE